MMYWILWPFSIIYYLIVIIRNTFYNTGLFKSVRFNHPVIVVGNITVGGTGKTPHIEYLVKMLSDICTLATLSRGYKRTTKGFRLVSAESSAAETGDEPLQIKLKFEPITVAVDEDRVHGIEKLLKTTRPEVILLDDAFQHRTVNAGLNIVLIDYNRPVDRDFVFPSGRLREPLCGLRRAQIIIVTKCPENIGEAEQQQLKKRFVKKDGQLVFFTTMKYGNLKPLFSSSFSINSIVALSNFQVLVVTGIAQPKAFFNYLSVNKVQFAKMEFPDHHAFTAEDIDDIIERFDQLNAYEKIIITTEKDAIRLKTSPKNGKISSLPVYYIPIEVMFINNSQNEFNRYIVNYIESFKQ